MLATLNPSLLSALAYVGGMALVASILGWALAIVLMTRRGAQIDPLRWAQHLAYGGGYFSVWGVLLVWLGRWVEGL
jgi:hypothetical protein